MTASPLHFTVHGIPGAQGSKRHIGRGVMVESSKKVKPWRSDVKAAAEKAIETWEQRQNGGGSWSPIAEAVEVSVCFVFARPRSHYGTGRNADVLKTTAPGHVTSRAAGDVDKLLRSTFDALVAAGVLHDDSVVTTVTASKVYADPGDVLGATVFVSPLARPAEVA